MRNQLCRHVAINQREIHDVLSNFVIYMFRIANNRVPNNYISLYSCTMNLILLAMDYVKLLLIYRLCRQGLRVFVTVVNRYRTI